MEFTQHSAEATLTIVTATGLEEKLVSFVLQTDKGEEDPVVLDYAMQALAMSIANSYFDGPNEG